MSPRPRYDQPVRVLAIITLAAFFLYGLLIACFPLLPFWIDEWLLIDNLKFKSSAQLWGALEHTQQFPRVYLELIKSFSAACDYSYTSLRLPSFLAHSFGLVLLYRLSGRIFTADNLSRFLWVMIYVSFNTSIHYFVQLKQYTMEMALSLAGIWQLLELTTTDPKKPFGWKYILLCFSFVVCPFFSYTYPIVIAPVYLIVALRSFKTKQWNPATCLPPGIGVVSVAACYQLDIRQVLADSGMQDFWQDLLMKTFSLKSFLAKTYMMFGNLGSGDLFGHLFGILGIAAFLYCSYATIKAVLSPREELNVLLLYSCLLLWLVLGLFVAGKLPLGTFRLNAFAVPAIAFMIIDMLRRVSDYRSWRPVGTGISMVLFLASVGNVYATMGELAGAEHAKKLRIYDACDRTIREATPGKLPVFVTSGIAYPFEDRWPGDWILKTHPRYNVQEPLQVYPMSGVDSAAQHIRRILPLAKTAIVLDGDSVRTIHL